MEIDLRAPDIEVRPLRTFEYGTNAGGGSGVRISVRTIRDGKFVTLTETVYRYVTRHSRDTSEETARWRELVAAEIV